MKAKSITMIAFSAVSVLCISGCAMTYRTYDGPKRSRETIAFVWEGDSSVISIDGIDIPRGFFRVNPSRVSLLPGQHTIIFSFLETGNDDEDRIGPISPLTVSFEAEAGKHYNFKAYRKEEPEYITRAKGLGGYLKKMVWRGSDESYEIWLIRRRSEGLFWSPERVAQAQLLEHNKAPTR